MIDSSCVDVLVVEDDDGIRGMLVQFLEDEGFSVAQTANGQHALSYLRHHPAPKAILFDLMMPLTDGWSFGLELKNDAAWVGIPRAVLTAVRLGEIELTVLGASGYFQKPFEPNAVAHWLRQHTSRPEGSARKIES